MQMSKEITMRRQSVFEVNHKMIVVWEEGPCLQNQPVIFRERE